MDLYIRRVAIYYYKKTVRVPIRDAVSFQKLCRGACLRTGNCQLYHDVFSTENHSLGRRYASDRTVPNDPGKGKG